MVTTDDVMNAMLARSHALRSLGYKVRIDITDLDESLLLDATGSQVTIRPASPSEEADTVLRLGAPDLGKLMAGRLNPMLAFSTGRLRVEGSKGVALKLASLLDEDG
ncbi:SCP2 sterol-binding domain-containing protein [Roseomonas gilardii subsp. gilardii]|uniref:SCP2 sterol-binding domain-containing protein n=1 Tax=Roseomonas gilardii TaxID=257708 RepID=UPI001FFC168E|nr:SCP2 sterol-binding domain-containing protein [Roseomonas gilardii]UPG73156.1 SCP2 sterol-binding domain-containing protein [Roseomonas gilardii subsp. gilardii]